MRAVLLLCAVCVYFVEGQNTNDMTNLPKYDKRYDYLDLDALFYSKRLVRNYVDCLINAQRCTPEGKQLKRILPEALRTKCVRCTEKQKKTAVKVIRRLKDEFPEEWAKLASRWDPTGDFTRYFEVSLGNEYLNTISGSDGSNEVIGPASLPSPVPSLPPSPAPSLPPSLPPYQPPRVPVPVTTPAPTQPAPASTPPAPVGSTPPRPVIINRFGDDGELMMGSPSSAAFTPRPTTSRPAISPNTIKPPQSRPTQSTWPGVDIGPTRFPAPYSTAITFIDRIGYQIIRTTELVTDILKSTVRAVVGS